MILKVTYKEKFEWYIDRRKYVEPMREIYTDRKYLNQSSNLKFNHTTELKPVVSLFLIALGFVYVSRRASRLFSIIFDVIIFKDT